MIVNEIIFSCYDFVERDLLEWLVGFAPVRDGYDNERGDQGDRVESDDDLSDKDESDEENEITHAVPSKCICAAHEKKNYQHHLEKAYLTLHEQDKQVNETIRPEPANPRDPSAVAIDLDYETGWTHADCILLNSELCKYLHPQIAAGDVVDVYVQHIKYRIGFFEI
jgi:hypothetical protein